MTNNHTAGFEYRLCHGIHIPGQQRTQVDDLARDTLLFSKLGGFADHFHLRTPAHQGNVGALFDHLRFTNWQLVVFIGHFTYGGTIEPFWL